MPFEPPDYAAALRDCVRGYSGSHQRAVLLAPDVFELFARLFADERVPVAAQPIINAVLAFFVAPQDVLPEDTLGPYGLLDDLFVASYAFRQLLRNILPPEVIDDAWQHDEPIEEVMAEVYTQSRLAVGKKRRPVLRMAGFCR